jgi:hypothetical protein
VLAEVVAAKQPAAWTLTAYMGAAIIHVGGGTRLINTTSGHLCQLGARRALRPICRAIVPAYPVMPAYPASGCRGDVAVRLAALRLAALRFAALRFAALRFAALRFAALRFAALRFAAPRCEPAGVS